MTVTLHSVETIIIWFNDVLTQVNSSQFQMKCASYKHRVGSQNMAIGDGFVELGCFFFLDAKNAPLVYYVNHGSYYNLIVTHKLANSFELIKFLNW